LFLSIKELCQAPNRASSFITVTLLHKFFQYFKGKYFVPFFWLPFHKKMEILKNLTLSVDVRIRISLFDSLQKILFNCLRESFQIPMIHGYG